MKKWQVVFIATAVVLSFQNCSKVVTPISDAKPNLDLENGVKETEVSQFKVMTLAKYPSVSDPHYKYYDIDLLSGNILAVERNAQGAEVTQQLCLTNAEKANLDQILDNAKVCETILNADALKDRLCTMIYKYPYASLRNTQEEKRLGEMVSGCDIPDDLCGAKAQQLKDFVQSLLATIDSHSCNSQ